MPRVTSKRALFVDTDLYDDEPTCAPFNFPSASRAYKALKIHAPAPRASHDEIDRINDPERPPATRVDGSGCRVSSRKPCFPVLPPPAASPSDCQLAELDTQLNELVLSARGVEEFHERASIQELRPNDASEISARLRARRLAGLPFQ
jgi:hypothetical protein